MLKSRFKYRVWMSTSMPVVHHTTNGGKIVVPYVREAEMAFTRFIGEWRVHRTACGVDDEDGLMPVVTFHARDRINSPPPYDHATAAKELKEFILKPREGDDPNESRTWRNTLAIVYVRDYMARAMTEALTLGHSDGRDPYSGLLSTEAMYDALGGICAEVRVALYDYHQKIELRDRIKYAENSWNVESTSAYEVVASPDLERLCRSSMRRKMLSAAQ